MNISDLYIYVDGSDLYKVSESVELSISEWLKLNNIKAKVVNFQYERTPDLSAEDYADWDLGLNISIDEIDRLSELLEFAYGLALKHNFDFVIGYYSEADGLSEDISYFGAESGKPNSEKLAEYLD